MEGFIADDNRYFRMGMADSEFRSAAKEMIEYVIGYYKSLKGRQASPSVEPGRGILIAFSTFNSLMNSMCSRLYEVLATIKCTGQGWKLERCFWRYGSDRYDGTYSLAVFPFLCLFPGCFKLSGNASRHPQWLLCMCRDYMGMSRPWLIKGELFCNAWTSNQLHFSLSLPRWCQTEFVDRNFALLSHLFARREVPCFFCKEKRRSWVALAYGVLIDKL